METWKIVGLIAMVIVPVVLALVTELFYPLSGETKKRYWRFSTSAKSVDNDIKRC